MKKNIVLLITVVTLYFSAEAQTSDLVKQYIETYKELAIREEIRTGIPASVTLAQGILESNAGQSPLSIASNNHFGIKCKNDWTGATVSHDDDSKGECFRKYLSVEESYRDHSDFLATRPNYAFLFSYAPEDCTSWAYGLKKAGYATNPIYAQMLLKIINDNGLQDYTLVALERMKKGETVEDNNMIVAKLDDESPLATNAVMQTPVTDYPSHSGAYPSGVFTVNHTKVLFASAGTSLFALANNSNISFAKLLEYNHLDKRADILQTDQLIFLEKKPKKSGSKDYHIVKEGETIELISQTEGVQLESLYEYNKVQKGLQPATGEKIYLRPGSPSYYPKLVKNTSR